MSPGLRGAPAGPEVQERTILLSEPRAGMCGDRAKGMAATARGPGGMVQTEERVQERGDRRRRSAGGGGVQEGRQVQEGEGCRKGQGFWRWGWVSEGDGWVQAAQSPHQVGHHLGPERGLSGPLVYRELQRKPRAGSWRFWGSLSLCAPLGRPVGGAGLGWGSCAL